MAHKKRNAAVEQHYLTIPQAAKVLGLPPFALRRAEKAGLINSYQPFSRRKRVILSEVRKAISEFRDGQSRPSSVPSNRRADRW